MRWLKNVFNTASENSKARFDFPFFRNPEIQRELAENGYSVQQLLTKDDVEQLNSNFRELLSMLGGPLPDVHWTSGRVEDTKVRNFAREAINRILPKRLEKYFDPEIVDFIGGIFVAKKPSPTSRLYPHQDSSHTDETKYPSVYAWVALTDTFVENGAMQVLPRSQLWGNKYRSLNVPWIYEGLQEKMFPLLKQVPMKAGEVLFFDSASIHYSTDNLGSEIRPAINFYIKPKEAKFLHHYIDDKTPKGKIEVFNVDIDFFYNHDFMKRPPSPPYSFLGYEDYDRDKLLSGSKRDLN